MNIDANINETIQDYLLAENMSPTAFAVACGLEKSVILRWRRAERMPKVVSLIKVADYMRVSLDFLLGLSAQKEVVCSYSCTFYQRLTQLLLETHTTKHALAAACSFSHTTFYNWEMGENAHIDVVYRIAKHFNVSVDYLVGRSDYR